MKAFDNAVRKFIYKHPRFGINNLMLYIVIGNIAVYLFSKMDTTGYFLYYLYFNPALILRGEIWRLITFIFIPSSDGLLFLVISLYFYYFIGSTLEHHWGSARFTLFYICGVVMTILYGIVMWLLTKSANIVFLDAQYINLSMFFAFATLYPDMQVLLFFFIPIKMKWLAYVDALLFLLSTVTNPFPVNLLPFIALLNYFLFCGDELLRKLGVLKYRYSARAVNFRREAKQATNEFENRPYRYKCSVCGRTDTDYPDLEFRYCSRCVGYHCFCADHINTHVHFTE